MTPARESHDPHTIAATLRARADRLQRLRHWLIRIYATPSNTPEMRDMADRLEWEILRVEDAMETEAERLAPWPVFTLAKLDAGKMVPAIMEDRV